MPRIFTLFENLISESPICMLDRSYLLRDPALPVNKTSVLLSFSINLFSFIYFFKYNTPYDCINLQIFALNRIIELGVICIKSDILKLNFTISCTKGCVYKVKRTGPRTES